MVISQKTPQNKVKFGMVKIVGNRALVPFEFDDIQTIDSGYSALKNGKLFYLDKNGKRILEFPIQVVSVKGCDSNLIAVAVKKQKGDPAANSLPLSWGFMNRVGQFVIDPKFCSVSTFKNGLAVAGILDDKQNTARYGVINTSGKWILPPQSCDSINPGRTMASIQLPENQHFDKDDWKNNRSHYSDLVKLFRDFKVIGMSRQQLLDLLGPPLRNSSNPYSYSLSAGIDTGTVIEFYIELDQVCAWRTRSSPGETDKPWTKSEVFPVP